jgi:arginine/lysine/ornithine decarboxylase
MQLASLIKRVQKRYPGSIVMQIHDEYHIMHEDESLNDIFLLPGFETEYEAWLQISQFVKMEQSINRTHPLKQMISEQKKRESQERIANRIHG